MFGHHIYKKSPIWVQEALIRSRALMRNLFREEGNFEKVLREIELTQSLGEEELRQYQLDKIVSLLRHSAANVPYYRDVFKREGFAPADFKDLSDLKNIPFLTKEHVIQSGSRLIASNASWVKIKGSTSGTTGTPLTIVQDRDAIVRENAFIWRQLHWTGFRKGQRRAWIRGEMIVPFEQRRAPFWRRNSIDNMLMMSSYHLSEATVRKYIEALESFDPVLVQAYPSSISYLGHYLDTIGQDYKGPSLRAVVTSSETLTDKQKEVLERRMGCRVFDWYGSFERVASIGTCEQGNYHVNVDYGFVELLPNGNGTAEIVGTGFNNRVMPLLRYRLGDVVVMENSSFRCPRIQLTSATGGLSPKNT